LLNAAAVLEAEPEIVCAVRVAVLDRAPIEVGGKRQIFANANAAGLPKLFSAAAFYFSSRIR
jgi:hypothetical protein